MGCGLNFDQKDIIVKLLNIENSDFTSAKDNEISCWSCTINVNSNNSNISKSANGKPKSKINNVSRLTFGLKSNNKVNNFNFQFYDAIENYITQYRNENKIVRCLPSEVDQLKCPDTFNKPQKDLLNCIISDIYPNKSELLEKSLHHQIPNDFNDFRRPMAIPQVMGPLPVSNMPSSLGQQQRSSYHNKRNLDMIIPQGTTYDILSDENRLNNGNIEINKLTVKIQDRTQSVDGFGLINFPYKPPSQETSKPKDFSREGGSLEFAKLLDEKLRTLCQQRNIYQPSMEFSRSKPDCKPKKVLSRQKSANYQIRNDYLSTLSVNGRSTGGLGKSSLISQPKVTEEQFSVDIIGRNYSSIKLWMKFNK